MPWTPASVWAIRDANGEHLRTIDTFLDMGRATDVRDLLRRQDRQGGMPWVNTTAADRAATSLYADHSVVPERARRAGPAVHDARRPGAVPARRAARPRRHHAPARPARGAPTTTPARPGVFGPSHLPEVFRRDWVVQRQRLLLDAQRRRSRLEGFARIIGCEECERTMRTRMVYQLRHRPAGAGGRHRRSRRAALRGREHQNRRDGRRGDARRTATSTRSAPPPARPRRAQALRRGTAAPTGPRVGTHLFEAFVAAAARRSGGVADAVRRRRPAAHPARPRTSPTRRSSRRCRTRSTPSATPEVPFDARWGSLQVAGDRGAPPIPLGGGTGDAVGNANALASRDPCDNTDRYRPITYGSSHIQAVPFLDGGRVDARTILTYGQSEDPHLALVERPDPALRRRALGRLPLDRPADRARTPSGGSSSRRLRGGSRSDGDLDGGRRQPGGPLTRLAVRPVSPRPGEAGRPGAHRPVEAGVDRGPGPLQLRRRGDGEVRRRAGPVAELALVVLAPAPAVPSVVLPHVCRKPASRELHVSATVTRNGTRRSFRLLPSPTRPSVFSPQHQPAPSVVVPHTCAPPTESEAHSWSPATSTGDAEEVVRCCRAAHARPNPSTRRSGPP